MIYIRSNASIEEKKKKVDRVHAKLDNSSAGQRTAGSSHIRNAKTQDHQTQPPPPGIQCASQVSSPLGGRYRKFNCTGIRQEEKIYVSKAPAGIIVIHRQFSPQ